MRPPSFLIRRTSSRAREICAQGLARHRRPPCAPITVDYPVRVADDIAHEIALARPRVARLAGVLCVALLVLLFAFCGLGSSYYDFGSFLTVAGATSFGAVIVGCLAITTVSLARSPRRRRLCWDAWGIREQQGPVVISAIAWSSARVHVERSASGWLEVVQIQDDVRTITVARYPTALPRWLARWMVVAPDLEPLSQMLERLPRATLRPIHDRMRPGEPWLRDGVLLPLALLVSVAGRESAPLLMAFGIAGVPSLVELVRSLAAAARAFGSKRVAIDGARPSELTARTPDGAELHLAFDRWMHPDARLGVEADGAAAFVRFERRAEPSEGPYRSLRPGAVRLILIETDGERALRRERIALTAVETALRLSVLVMALA